MNNRGLVNEVGTPIEFSDHAFLAEIYSDTSPLQVWEKGSQIGLTTTQIFKTINLAEMRGFQIIYTLPTVEDIQIFSKSKVNKILALNPDLTRSMGAGKGKIDAVEEKHFGRGMIHYRGTFKESHAISITSDLNVHDELDRSDLTVVETYESRLQASKHAWQWFFSNPSAPERGVDFYFRMSDQKYWFFRCPHCDFAQYIDWFGKDFTNVDKENQLYVCHHCHREVEDETRRSGFWVPYVSEVNMPYSGYWIPQTIAPWMSCEKIMKLEREKGADYFYNFCLGLPYRGTDRVVSEEMIFNAIVESIGGEREGLSIGVDQGGTDENPVLHIVVGDNYGIRAFKIFKSWDELDNYISMSNAALTVIDGNPKREPIKKLRDKYHHRVVAAFYKTDPKGIDIIRWKDKEGHVLISRDAAIDNMIDQFVDGNIKIAIPQQDPAIRDYTKQWQTMGLYEKRDDQGNIRKVWESSTGRDHLVHATLYWLVARSRAKLYTRKKREERKQTPLERQMQRKERRKNRQNSTWS